MNAAGRGAEPAFVSLPRQRRVAQQRREQMLPELRIAGGAVPARLRRRPDEIHAAVLHAPDFVIENSELSRIEELVGDLRACAL